jgi:hypothetical protein
MARNIVPEEHTAMGTWKDTGGWPSVTGMIVAGLAEIEIPASVIWALLVVILSNT